MGYWLPHTSSIDFCEANYLHFHHIVEPHNVWSSIVGISAFGLLGLKSNPTQEWRFTLTYAVLALIGVGSAGLHGSLHWVFQSSDELPMIYMVLGLVYMCAEVDAPLGRPKHPWLAHAVFGVAVVNTLVYYIFQHLYWVFLVTFSLGSAAVILWSYQLTFRFPGRGDDSKRIALTGLVSFLLLGFTSWVFDMLLCNEHVIPVANSLPGPFRGMTPHVVWHIAAGLGGYCGAANLCLCRMEALGMDHSVSYLLGIVPVLKGKRGHGHTKKTS